MVPERGSAPEAADLAFDALEGPTRPLARDVLRKEDGAGGRHRGRESGLDNGWQKILKYLIYLA